MRPFELIQFIHTPLFDESMAAVPMTDEELRSLQNDLQANPEAGNLVRGTGGARKIRVGVERRGKSAGARVIYYYAGRDRTIYLILAFSKKDAATLSQAGKTVIRALIQELSS